MEPDDNCELGSVKVLVDRNIRKEVGRGGYKTTYRDDLSIEIKTAAMITAAHNKDKPSP